MVRERSYLALVALVFGSFFDGAACCNGFLSHFVSRLQIIADIMIKPDGVQRGIIGEIVKRFEAKGFKLVAMKLTAPGKEHMEKHYIDLKEKKFFPGLISYMTSGPVVGMVWEGKDAVKTGRKMLGATMPSESDPGTIRGDLCVEVGRNICHGSDSVESAENEIALWFPEGTTQWESCQKAFIYE